MKINLFLDKRYLKNKNSLEGIMDYYKRCSRFVRIKLYYELDQNLIDSKDAYNINVSIKGKYIDSINFSNIIKSNSINRVKNLNILFDEFNCYNNICFVNFNLDRDLLYLVVLEQIYRSYKIINNEPYHK